MFYLTLPSNSSMNYYPDNTLAHYTTVLAQDVDLSGRWEVGLSEIQYPYSWHNMNNYAGWLIVHKDRQTKKMDLPPGQYDTPEQLIAGLNQLFSPAPPPYTARNMTQEPPVTLEVTLGQPITYNLGDQEPKVTFVYHKVSQKATIQVHEECQIELSPTLQRMLGMHEAYLSKGSHQGVHVVDVNQGFYSLYVYCNLIEPWLVGDSRAPLLCIVPIEGHGGQMITKTYQHIHYLPLLQKHFRTIEIDIKKDTGERVPFELGKLVVTLHFRKQKPNL